MNIDKQNISIRYNSMSLLEVFKYWMGAVIKLIYWFNNKGGFWGDILKIIIYLLSLIQIISIHGGVQGFPYYWFFSGVTLNSYVTMWFIGSKYSHITAFKLSEYWHFNYVKRVDIFIDIRNLVNRANKA